MHVHQHTNGFIFILLDFQDDIGQHIIVLKEFLASLEDTVDGTGSGRLIGQRSTY